MVFTSSKFLSANYNLLISHIYSQCYKVLLTYLAKDI